MIGDPIPAMQAAVRNYLATTSGNLAVNDGVISAATPWRPHVYQPTERVAWQLHSAVPDSSSWEARIQRALAVGERKLQIGVGATEETLMNAEFQMACHRVGARLLLLKARKDEFVVGANFSSVPDFVCEERIKLAPNVAREMLDLAHARALKATTKNEKGVSLEVLIALVLSQVDNFEVTDIGISNRSQQMDVMVHNRNVSGVLGASPLVLAEAKNWGKKVTPNEHAPFLRKLQSRQKKAKLGFLVTTGSFTKGVLLEIRRDSKEDIVIVLLDGKALPTIWRAQESITRRIERLVIDATVGY